jgi:hypothetical protein
MTTTVTVKAHCDSKTTKVKVQTIDTANQQPDVFIEDGEVVDVVVYDERSVTISEVPKEQ